MPYKALLPSETGMQKPIIAHLGINWFEALQEVQSFWGDFVKYRHCIWGFKEARFNQHWKIAIGNIEIKVSSIDNFGFASRFSANL